MRSTIAHVCGIAVLIVVGAASVFASGPATAPAPEIDGASIATGLAGLSAAVMILRARHRSK